MSRVDVVIPCYRYAHYLRACVNSVLSQEGVDVRVLIIDDCSPDNTAEIAVELAASDRRVEFRRHDTNRGHIATYNEGLLHWADADYCQLLSADDMLTAGALARAASLMDRYPQVAMTYGRGVWTTDPALEPPPGIAMNEARVIPGERFIEEFCAEGGNLITTPTVVVRTSVQKRAGGYRADLPHAGDMEMWMRLAAHGDIGFIDEFQAFYRVHGHNMNRGFVGADDLRQRGAAFNVLFGEYRGLLKEPERLRQLASRSLASSAFWSGAAHFDQGALGACRECHELALQFCPDIRNSAAWWKFQCKRVIGPLLWAKIRPLVARVRGRGPAGRSQNALSAVVH